MNALSGAPASAASRSHTSVKSLTRGWGTQAHIQACAAHGSHGSHGRRPNLLPVRSLSGGSYFHMVPTHSLTFSDKIRKCNGVDDLRSLLLGHHQSLSPSELALAFSRLSQINSSASSLSTTSRRIRARNASAGLAVRLLETCDNQMQQMDAAGLGQVIHTLARLRCRISPDWVSKYLALSLTVLPTCTTRQLATQLRALSQVVGYNAELWRCKELTTWLKMFMRVSQPLLNSFTPDDLSITIAAVRDLACTPYRPPSTWMLQYAQAVRVHMSSFECRQLAQVMSAFARLQFKPDREWAAAFQKQVQMKIALFDASDLALLLASVVDGRPMILLEVAVVDEMVVEAVRKLPTFKLSALSRLLYALAALDKSVDPYMLDAALLRLQASLPKARTATLSDLAWSLPNLSHPPSPAFISCLESASLSRITAFQKAELVGLITGFAMMRWSPSWEWMEGVALHGLQACPGLKDRSGLIHALAGLGCPGTPAVARLVADTVGMAARVQDFKDLTAVQQVQLLWGAAHLSPSHLPHSWLHKWCKGSRRHAVQFTPALWSDILQAMTQTSFRPDTEWIAAAAVCLQSTFHTMKAWELAGCVTGLAGVGYSASPRWAISLQEAAAQQLPDFSVEDFVQLGWGLAQMQHPLIPQLREHWVERVVPAVMTAQVSEGYEDERAGVSHRVEDAASEGVGGSPGNDGTGDGTTWDGKTGDGSMQVGSARDDNTGDGSTGNGSTQVDERAERGVAECFGHQDDYAVDGRERSRGAECFGHQDDYAVDGRERSGGAECFGHQDDYAVDGREQSGGAECFGHQDDYAVDGREWSGGAECFGHQGEHAYAVDGREKRAGAECVGQQDDHAVDRPAMLSASIAASMHDNCGSGSGDNPFDRSVSMLTGSLAQPVPRRQNSQQVGSSSGGSGRHSSIMSLYPVDSDPGSVEGAPSTVFTMRSSSTRPSIMSVANVQPHATYSLFSTLNMLESKATTTEHSQELSEEVAGVCSSHDASDTTSPQHMSDINRHGDMSDIDSHAVPTHANGTHPTLAFSESLSTGSEEGHLAEAGRPGGHTLAVNHSGVSVRTLDNEEVGADADVVQREVSVRWWVLQQRCSEASALWGMDFGRS